MTAYRLEPEAIFTGAPDMDLNEAIEFFSHDEHMPARPVKGHMKFSASKAVFEDHGIAEAVAFILHAVNSELLVRPKPLPLFR
jgi:hypothetical protein